MSQIIQTNNLLNRVKEAFRYSNGNLIWAIPKKGTRGVGSIAGRINSRGYRQIGLDRKIYMAHRLIFLFHHGWLPEQIDHINGNCSDNRIENLRAATMAQNMRNRAIQSNNTSGCKGVTFNQVKKKWMVNCRLNKSRHFLGYYKDKELADLVAKSFREKYHGEFCNHGSFNHV
ncbi:HNH endonuclease [Mixta calida]|uniref:HNH endonuclease n=1 Tax=Mixta calida TaxID=665913 RepID=UPI003CEA711E